MIRFILLFLLSPIAVFAQDGSQEAIDRLSQTFNGYSSYKIDFVASIKGEVSKMQGSVVVSGKRFFVDMGDVKIYYDGVAQYTYSAKNEEVTIETLKSGSGFMANPAEIFNLSHRGFNTTKLPSIYNGDKKIDIISLVPKDVHAAGVKKIILYIDSNGVPKRLNSDLVGGGAFDLHINKVNPNVTVTDGMFLFDTKSHPNVEVIDFR